MTGRPIRVLHLASFTGNVGDNAMHDGEERTRAEDVARPFAVTRLEIRDFIHWRTRRFDDAFLAEANAHDLLLVGGDSVFSPWLAETATGTYFDVEPGWFDGIRRPIVFHGLGCDAARGVTDASARGMAAFLDAVLSRPDRFLSFRNDGSADVVAAAVGGRAMAATRVVPDGGLFARPEAAPLLDPALRWVAVNVAGDMPDVRFPPEAGGAAGFHDRIAATIGAVLATREDVGVVLVPHIHADVAAAAAVLARVDDRVRRTRVAIGPYVQGPAGWQVPFDLYRRAETVLAMRFHAALVPLGLGRSVTGLSTHPKVAAVFAGLGLSDRVVTAAVSADGLAARILADLDGLDAALLARTRAAVARERATLAAVHGEIAAFLDRFV